MNRAHLAVVLALASAACGGSNASSAPPTTGTTAPPVTTATTTSSSTNVTPQPTATTQMQMSPPIDEKAVAAATGAKTENADGIVKASFPRNDVPVEVDGSKLPPFMGLTSWVAFTPGKSGVEAMMMGDLVLFEDEVNRVMSTLLDHNVSVTALHNHFFFSKPAVYFMHVEGEGAVASLGGAVKTVMETIAETRKKTPKPLERSGAAALPAKSAIDGAKLDATFGLKGQSKDGMYKATMGRKATAECGCAIGKAMGVNTWAAFAGTDDNAVVDGDFAVTEAELQPVLKALRGGNIDVVAIHSHMTGENPRILFLHYWGRGKAADLANVVKKAVDLTAWDGRTQST
jgi:hypothetical protein